MSQDSGNSKPLVLKYLAVFTAFGLGAAVYFAATVSGLAAALVFVACVEAGSVFAGLAYRQQGRAFAEVVMARGVDLNLGKPLRDIAE